MTITQSLSLQALVLMLSDEEQHRLRDALMSGEPVPDDIRQRLEELARDESGGTSGS